MNFFYLSVVYLIFSASFAVQAQERLPSGLIEVLNTTQVGINKVCIESTDFTYSDVGDLTKEKDSATGRIRWVRFIGRANFIRFNSVSVDVQTETLWLDGSVVSSNAPVPRSEALVIVGGESALKKQISGHSKTLTDEKGGFKLETQVKPKDRLYFCHRNTPINEFLIHEFMEELKSAYRIHTLEDSDDFDLNGTWIISWNDHREQDDWEWESRDKVRLKIQQDGQTLSGLAEFKDRHPKIVLEFLGEIDGDELKLSMTFPDPFGFTDAGTRTMIWAGKVNQLTLSGTWAYEKQEKGAGENEWIAYRKNAEETQDSQSESAQKHVEAE